MDLVLRDNTDRVHDNRIDGGNYGIKIVGKSSTSGPQIGHNVIRAFLVNGIYNGDTTFLRFENNAVVEGGEPTLQRLSFRGSERKKARVLGEDAGLLGSGPARCRLASRGSVAHAA